MNAQVERPAKIERMDWATFLRYLHRVWKPGDHLVELGPAGGGKSFLASEILDTHKYIVALDIKGLRDPSIIRLVDEKGFIPITSWPVKDEKKRLKDHLPLRYVLSPPNKEPGDLYRMGGIFREVLQDIYRRGGWSVYLDELRVVCDANKGMDLGGDVENLILVSRYQGTSVIGASQAPRWIPHAMYDQAVHAFFFNNRDHLVVQRLAEIAGGADRREIAAIVRNLRHREVLYVGGANRRMIVTKAKATGPRGGPLPKETT